MGPTAAGAPLLVDAARTGRPYTVKLVGGSVLNDEFGFFQGYYVYPEERAPIDPAPVYEYNDIFTGKAVRLVPESEVVAVTTPAPTRRRQSKTKTKSLDPLTPAPATTRGPRVKTRTIDPRRSTLTWHVGRAPFGALPVRGPKYWAANTQSRIVLTNLRFDTAGVYVVNFNLTTYLGVTFKYNQTYMVNRQPDVLKQGRLAQAYNGSAFAVPATASLLDFLGNPVFTSSPVITLEFQAFPNGTVFRGSLTKKATVQGTVSFSDVSVSLPGSYTYRIVALLSDGSKLSTTSFRIDVERALPARIVSNTVLTGVARFRLFNVPIFRTFDTLGPSYDSRMNMTLSISLNNPSVIYEGGNTEAAILGTASVVQDEVGYAYRFDDVAIDLPGTYQIEARLIFPNGAGTLALVRVVRILNAPTFAVYSRMIVNNIGVLSLYGERPKVNPVSIKLSSSPDCKREASDELPWPTALQRGNELDFVNMSVVPFIDGDIYVCMRIPSQPTFAPLVKDYQPQFDELFPLIFTYKVGSVAECLATTALNSRLYAIGGWRDVAEGRRYGCRLTPPVSGTVPPCTCPTIYTCDPYRHPLFTPPNLDIGLCVCCATWIVGLAGTVGGLFMFAMLYVVIFHA